MDDTRSVRQWRCARCGALLGIARGSEVELKYKVALYRVRGVVEAACRRCGVVSRLESAGRGEDNAATLSKAIAEEPLDLRSMLCALATEVRAERHQMRFEEAKERYPILAPYATAEALIAFFAERTHRLKDRDALSSVLVQEQRNHPQPLWAAVLLVAYGPMLRCLRARLQTGTWGPGELDQMIVTAFLQCVASFPRKGMTSTTCVALRQNTHRRVYTALRAHRRREAFIEAVSPFWMDASALEGDQVLDVLPDGVLPDGFDVRADGEETERLDEQLALLARVSHLKGPDLRLLIDTFVRGERLRAYVNRLYPELEPTERVQMYERLKRRRSRAAARLFKPLKALCRRSKEKEREALEPMGERRALGAVDSPSRGTRGLQSSGQKGQGQ